MKKFKDFLKNNQDGSTIIWAVGVILVLLIILGGALSISKSYSVRSIRNSEEEQAYLTARSAIDAIIYEIQHPLSDDKTAMNPRSAKIMKALSDNAGVEIKIATAVKNGAGNDVPGPNFDFDGGADPFLGQCDLSIKFIKGASDAPLPSNYPSALPTPTPEADPVKFCGDITITAKVTYSGGEKIVVAKLVGTRTASVNGKVLVPIQDHKDANGNDDMAEVFTRWIVKSYEEG